MSSMVDFIIDNNIDVNFDLIKNLIGFPLELKNKLC